MKRYKTVDDYVAASAQWSAELAKLRKTLQATGLEETVKWGAPVYTFEGKNVVGIGGFKSYVGLWFFQGALLADRKKLLINAQEGRTKALRQMRFQSIGEIDTRAIKAYVREAIGLVEEGVEIKPVRAKPVKLPSELKAALSKRREYADHIASAKQDATRQRRLDKILPMIEAGIGLNDRYRGC